MSLLVDVLDCLPQSLEVYHDDQGKSLECHYVEAIFFPPAPQFLGAEISRLGAGNSLPWVGKWEVYLQTAGSISDLSGTRTLLRTLKSSCRHTWLVDQPVKLVTPSSHTGPINRFVNSKNLNITHESVEEESVTKLHGCFSQQAHEELEYSLQFTVYRLTEESVLCIL